jgi:hypothetical protein
MSSYCKINVTSSPGNTRFFLPELVLPQPLCPPPVNIGDAAIHLGTSVRH